MTINARGFVLWVLGCSALLASQAALAADAGRKGSPETTHQHTSNSPTVAAVGTVVIVKTVDRERVDVPVSVWLSGSLASMVKSRTVQVVEISDGNRVVVTSQVEPGARPRLWWMAHGRTSPQTRRQFRMESIPPATGTKTSNLTVAADDKAVTVYDDGEEVLRYNAAAVLPPEGIGPEFTRGAFLHPVRSPSGRVVSDQYPPDHAHQNGFFLAYTKTEFEGRQPNFWEVQARTGIVRFVKTAETASGPLFASFLVWQQHVDLTSGKEKPVLDETWRVRVWKRSAENPNYRAVDLISTRSCASASPLAILKYHYGGMAVRGARGWSKDQSRFLTSAGKTRETGNHTRPRWCDLSGPVDGAQAGFTFMTHPQNFRYPEPLRIHPRMPYMVYTPAHLGEWRIEPGRSQTSRYRFVVHDGPVETAIAERFWNHFALPVKVIVADKP